MENNSLPRSINPRMAMMAGAASVVTVLVLIAIKGIAFAQSGSAGVLASLMDSLVDIMASLMTFFAIRFSLKPADDDHRSGHGKIEGLAALAQAALIAAGGVLLAAEAVQRFITPQEIEHHSLAVAVMAVSVVLSFILVRIQNYALSQAPSLAVEADQLHYAADIVINAGVIVVISFLWLGGPLWIDPFFALLVCAHLGFVAVKIGGKAVDMLLDRELPDVDRMAIARIIRACPGVRGMHDLRTSRSGMKTFMSFDIEVDSFLMLSAAHDIARDVERTLLATYPAAEIMIHVDPADDTEDSRHS